MGSSSDSANPSRGFEGRVSMETAGTTLLIGIDRPAKRNALTPGLLRGLSEAYQYFELQTDLRCAVLFGHGPAFCAGADLTQMFESVEATDSQAATMSPFQMGGSALSKPLIVAVHGACLGGGMELALAGDIIVASEDAQFGQPETQRGIFAFGGGSVRWPLRVGWGNAQRYLLTGDLLDAHEAWRLGLVQEVVAEGTALDRAIALADRIAHAAPVGVRDTLAVGRCAIYDGPERAFEEQARRRPLIMATKDAEEGRTAFTERRDPEYVGR